MFKLRGQKTKKNWITKSSILVLILGLSVNFFPAMARQAQAATVATPVFSPSGGTITTKTKISLSTATSGATIYYTINGTAPTTSSYRYDSAIGVDLQPGSAQFFVGSKTIKAIAVKSGSTNSATVTASFTVTNKDQSSRNTLANKQIGVNKDDCWLVSKTNCTSLVSMRSATISEIGYFAQGCNSWLGGSYSNRCGVLVTGGTEAGHAESGNCPHSSGYKFDMSPTTSVTNFIKTSGQFTYLGPRSDGAAMYKWRSGGAIYAKESTHWDVVVGTGC